MMKATMKKATSLLLGTFVLASFSVVVNAQTTNAIFEDGKFVFFIDGVNVQVPSIDGTVVNDPLDPTSGNKAFEIPYADWSEAGFRWSSNGPSGTVGFNMLDATGENYGETDTLYMRFMSDSANLGKNDFISFFDTEDGGLLGEDLPFRMRWYIPNEMRNNEWHTVALPLPTRTFAMLDSAKAGVKFNGDSLNADGITVDSLFQNWGYDGAWAAGSAAGVFGGPTDPNFMEWDWESVKYFGRHIDHASGGGSIFIDYAAIGVPPSDLIDAAPPTVAAVAVSNTDGSNDISWGSVTGAGGYKLYFSESEITDVLAEGVLPLGTFGFEDELAYSHAIEAPHEDYASEFEAFYAVTSVSNFGSESAGATNSITSTIKVSPNYVVELSNDAVDAVFAASEAGVVPEAATLAAFFPDSYMPFTIDANRKIIENGSGGDDDADISAKVWIGYGEELNELIVYAEITDDAFVFAGPGVLSEAAWAYDSWEMGLGNYSPESFLISSTHTTYERGAEPDYQFRAGLRSGEGDPFVFANSINADIPFSTTIGDMGDTGYRLLTFIDTFELSKPFGENTEGDAEFVFPATDAVATYPFNLAINDNDDTSRETQVSWSLRAGGDNWWNNPTRFQTIAFVGREKVTAVSNEVEDEGQNPFSYKLDQNYPNPFNPTTNISFSLASSSDVTLEVFNMLGQKVATLLQNEKRSAGDHNQSFNASSLSSGMYVYRLSTSSFVQSRKMMLIK